MPKKKIVKKKHNKGNTKNVIAPKRYETKVGNTVCKKHGKRWLLDPQHSTLCCAPDCLISLVEVHSHKSESIKKLLSVINKHHNREDLTSYMVERFLIEMEDGKPAILNRTWLWFTLQRFIRDEMIQQEIEDELLEAQRITEDNTSSWTKRYTSETPEKILIGKDLLAFVAEEEIVYEPEPTD